MASLKFALLVFGLLACTYGQTTMTFSANIQIWNDPQVTGTLSGVLYYDKTINMQRIDYTIGPKEIINATAGLKYLYCAPTCDASTYRVAQPIFYQENGDVRGSDTLVNGVNCQLWTKPSASNPNQVSAVYINNNRIYRADFVSGKYIFFSGHTTFASTLFRDFTTWNCPAQVCNVQMDLLLVFDESGSITATSFGQMKQFGLDVVRSFTIGPQAVYVGLIMFSSSGRVQQDLTNNRATIENKINTVTQIGGGTCIPCGISVARTNYLTKGRNGVQRVLIVLTDGENNVNNGDFDPQINAADSEGAYLSESVSEIRSIRPRSRTSELPTSTTSTEPSSRPHSSLRVSVR